MVFLKQCIYHRSSRRISPRLNLLLQLRLTLSFSRRFFSSYLNLNQDLTSNKDSLAKLRKLVNATASQEDTEEHVIERISLILGNDTIH